MPYDDGTQELRVALYSHDSVGLGHTRRNLAIAQALADSLPGLTGRRISGLLITGEGSATSYACPPGFDWVVMPGIRKSTGRYVPRNLAVRSKALLEVRSAVIEGALTSFRPHIVIVDRHAFGVDSELEGPLKALKASKPNVSLVLGLREILDDPAVAAAEWERVGVQRVRDTFDHIWVYGDRYAHDVLASGEVPKELADMVDYTGLLASGRKFSGRVRATPRPFVLTMVGGGSDGAALALASAAAPVPEGYQHLVVTGPQMPAADRHAVEAAAGPRTTVTAKVSDGMNYVNSAHALVAMAGYNTVTEALSTATPTLLVPRVEPRIEQLMRARGLGAVGAVDWQHPHEADSEQIGQWLAHAVGDPRVAQRQREAREGLALDGLAQVVRLAGEISLTTDKGLAPDSPLSMSTAKKQRHIAQLGSEYQSPELVRTTQAVTRGGGTHHAAR